MSAPAKFAAFVAGLVVIFAIAFATGAAIDPEPAPPLPAHRGGH